MEGESLYLGATSFPICHDWNQKPTSKDFFAVCPYLLCINWPKSDVAIALHPIVCRRCAYCDKDKRAYGQKDPIHD